MAFASSSRSRENDVTRALHECLEARAQRSAISSRMALSERNSLVGLDGKG